MFYCNIGLKGVVFFEFIYFYLRRVERRERDYNTRKDRINVFIYCQITITWQWNKRLRFCSEFRIHYLKYSLVLSGYSKVLLFCFSLASWNLSETISCTALSVNAVDPILCFLKGLPFAGFRFHCGNLDVGQMPL